ncbi:MAG: prolyl-tRNA synthetase associated domain-containing protein [Bacteroides sp.]|nr:prolyl-tRNA synthetase associated domain-containing protein [Barnesiella sp.]MBD5253232.1 prolyl-tRNA synthetase associated domain-containing protein [Barnesiella sp.]MBD5343719.1 prolyl-tRNA synthetase associated domain-containing protein [Bacteroides sp.]MBD5367891.1 prolyl-tRNA synthetase associated domain-containing protein [Bacteroides sp.]
MESDNKFYTSEVMTGAPAEFKSDTQRLIYESLDSAGIPYTRIESDPGISMDDCLNIDRAFGIDTVKTILLTNRQKNRFWLYVTHARKAFITKEFGASLQIPRVSFADEDLMMSVLGTRHGAATPFGLLRPEAADVTFVMDRDVAARDKIVITDGDPCGFIAIAVSDLFRLIGRSPVLIENPAEIMLPEGM